MTRVNISNELRRLVFERAHGQCEYCLTPEVITLVPHEIDHIIAQKHGGPTEPDNLALACSLCNKHKGTDLATLDPTSGAITPLFHPRKERWQAHFELQEASIVGHTAIGKATVRLLQFNLPARVTERKLLLQSGSLRLPD